MRTIASVTACIALAIIPLGCWLSDDPGPSSSGYCNDACSKVYNQCGLELKTSTGAGLTFGQCLSTCESTGHPASVSSCVAPLSCSNGVGIAACFNATTPPPPASTCTDSCAMIYDTCQLTLQSTTGPISKAHCIGLCEDDDAKSQKISCVLSKTCADGQGIANCINAGTEPPIDDCPSACSEVYNWCELVINVGGVDLTEDECVSHCNAVTGGTIWGCVDTANCDGTALGACFQ